MLYEVKDFQQPDEEYRCRWFTDAYFDLFVWFKKDNSIFGFQLCYDKNYFERAFTWTEKSGYSHLKVDDGNVRGLGKMTPILTADGVFDSVSAAEKFKRHSKNLDKELIDFVYKKIIGYLPHKTS